MDWCSDCCPRPIADGFLQGDTPRRGDRNVFCVYFIRSYNTWFLGATVTFVTWGWVGVIIGLIIAGVGVVPIGILAAFISLKEPALGFSLIVMVVIVFATRIGGASLMQSEGEV